MAINVAFGVSIRPKFRAFLVPWLERKGPTTVWCCTGRKCFSSGSSSSPKFPVRYIPGGKSLKADGPEKGVNEMELDGLSECSASEGKAPAGKQLRKGSSFRFDDGMQLHEDEFGKEKVPLFLEVEELGHSIQPSREPRKQSEEFARGEAFRRHKNIYELNTEVGSSVQDAEKLVIELLARRAYTAAELRKKLLGKRFSPKTVEFVMTDIKSRGLINDSLYAETYSQSRWSSSSWGPRRIKQALFKKGVRAIDAENALKQVFQNGESGDQESAPGMSQNSMDQLLAQASKKWLQSRDEPVEKRKARVVRWLQYRGHNWSVTSFILSKLQSLVSEVDAETAVKRVSQDGDSGHQESAPGMSQKNSMDQLLAQVSKKWLQSRDEPVEKRKARIVRWLQYRGHNWSVTSALLKKLQSLHPP